MNDQFASHFWHGPELLVKFIAFEVKSVGYTIIIIPIIFRDHYSGIARWHKHNLHLIIPLFPNRKQHSKMGKRQNCFLLYPFYVTFTQAFCLKYAVSLLTQLEGEPSGSLFCDLTLRRQKANTMSSSQECTNEIHTLHLSTKSLSAMISTERGSWPAGAFSGISWSKMNA